MPNPETLARDGVDGHPGVWRLATALGVTSILGDPENPMLAQLFGESLAGMAGDLDAKVARGGIDVPAVSEAPRAQEDAFFCVGQLPKQLRACADEVVSGGVAVDTAPGMGDSLLLSMRHTLRSREVSIRHSPRELAPFFGSVWLRVCNVAESFPDIELNEKVLSRLARMLVLASNPTDASNPESLATVDVAAERFFCDVRALAQAGAHNPAQLSFYHGPQIVGQVRDACSAYPGLFTESDIRLFLYRGVIDPVGGVHLRARKIRSVRERIEPWLRTECGYDKRLSDRFLKAALAIQEDETIFFERWLADRAALREAYPDAQDEIEVYIQDGEGGFGAKLAAVARREPKQFLPTEEELDRGEQEYERLVTALVENRSTVPSAGGRLMFSALELVRHIRHNASVFSVPDDLDLVAACTRLIRFARGKGGRGKAPRRQPHEAAEEIYEDAERYMGLFNAYLKNVDELVEAGCPRRDAVRNLAFCHTAITFRQMLELGERTGFSRAGTLYIVAKYSRAAADFMHERGRLLHELRQEYGGAINGEPIEDLVLLFSSNASRSKVARRLRRYAAEFAGAHDQISALHPWVTRAKLKNWFFDTDLPVQDIFAWAARTDEAKRLYPKMPGLTLERLMRLRASRQQDTKEVVESYWSRVEALELECQTRGVSSMMSRSFLSEWGIGTAGFRQLDDFLSTASAIKDELAFFGYEVADQDLGWLAYKAGTRSPIQVVSRFLDRRRQLSQEFAGNLDVHTWMIDSAATRVSLHMAKSYLAWVSRLKGVRDKQMSLAAPVISTGVSRGRVLTLDDTQSDQTADAAYLSQRREDLKMVDEALLALSPIEREAVKCAFGIEGTLAPDIICEELGIDIDGLEAHVMGKILPVMRLQ